MRTPFILLLLLLIPQASLKSAEPSKPNIVVFLADDMGWGDSATYGHPLIKTPNLDRLAQQGVVFSRHYADATCAPSRVGIMTGRYPERSGFRSKHACWVQARQGTQRAFGTRAIGR